MIKKATVIAYLEFPIVGESDDKLIIEKAFNQMNDVQALIENTINTTIKEKFYQCKYGIVSIDEQPAPFKNRQIYPK